MEGKECECEALRLIRAMIKAYDTWGESPSTGEKVLALIASDIKKHLSLQLYYGGYPEKQQPYYSQMMGIRTALKRYDSGEDDGVSAMEVVRDTLHKSDELKQLMVCGPPYTNKESLTETAKVLAEGLNTMSESTTKGARSILDKQYEKLECPE